MKKDKKKTDEIDWKQNLTDNQYAILRKHGTEPAFTSNLNSEKKEGNYYCAGCNAKLFSSKMKFDSGTGWPSFYKSYPGAFKTSTDYKLVYPRTEYHCATCKGHHGHLFEDGPEPTGKRFCNNGIALKFIEEEVKDE